MKIITAVHAKNHFGKFLDMAQREPVLVIKNGQPVGVFLSMEDIEDTMLGEQALKAHEKGYLSADDSDALLSRLISA
jgi:prevent-host-death family protein